jgi:catechol 2,3-dioxygenase-like lactoylglutathione lyase family enzyme
MAEMRASTTGLLTMEPILAVRDMAATAAYYRDALGFEEVWLWGEPPTHGGANWDGLQIQFSLDPALAASAEGRAIWIRVRNVQAMYALHRERGAEIVAALEPKPWGVSEYVVRDPDGYRLRFAGSGSLRHASDAQSGDVQIEPRLPTRAEMEALIDAVGWARDAYSPSGPRVLEAALYGAVAVADGETVGCAFLTSDNAGFANGPEGALVGLFTGGDLHAFYAQFGFRGPGAGLYGMTRVIGKE